MNAPAMPSPPFAYRAFQVVYALLALNFLLPAASYLVAPELAVATMSDVNRLLGGGAWPSPEATHLWHMLAVGNVMTLGFLCALLLFDLLRFYPALPALVFLKAFSALYSLFLGASQGIPAFYAVFALDGTTTLAMVFFAVRAHRAISRMPEEERPLPMWWRLLFLRPERVRRSLALVQRAGIVERTPTLFQVWLGVLRMWLRVLFRPGTVGTCSTDPIRPSLRARLLAFRALRLPFLVVERAIAPLDMSGFESSPARVIRHLIGAHHDGPQLAYDLELLVCHEGALEELCRQVRRVVEEDTPRSRWLRDLCVFEGYHERLLERAERARHGDLGLSPDVRGDPDLSFAAYLDWCARQPDSLGGAVRVWWRRHRQRARGVVEATASTPACARQG